MDINTEISTEGIQIKTRRRWLAEVIELISSMRFSISLLTVIAIASIIGTVLQQGQPLTSYINKFGPFWTEIFGHFSLYAVYSAWWFLLIMGLLVVSTSLCIVRNTPRMLKDMRSWRENVREQSLRNFHHNVEWSMAGEPSAAARDTAARIAAEGYKVKLVEKGGAVLIAAKQGAANKWGYIFAHSAIVIICIGGMLDSDLPIRFQQWVYGKKPFAGTAEIARIPAENRLSASNPTYRAYLPVSEGESANVARIPRQDGVLLQDLPFTIELKKFTIDYYSTGMPKLFSSEVMVHDPADGKRFAATIRVNEPLIYKGLAIYQSSFEDGGSRLKLTGYPMTGLGKPFKLAGLVNGTTPLQVPGIAPYSVEWSGFRPFNVENTVREGQDLRAVNSAKSFNEKLTEGLEKSLGSAAKKADRKDFKNVGPSVQYKLRDATGQAREYHNYMLPVPVDGVPVFHAGVRNSPNENFSYLRIPADENDSIEEWMRVRAAVVNPELRKRAAQRYSQRALGGKGDATLRAQLEQSAIGGMAIFAGNEKESGFLAVTHFLEKMPKDEQMKNADIFIKILNASLWELWQVAREADGLKPVPLDEKSAKFLQLAINAYSDAHFYGAPVFLQLNEFEEVKASVFQVTRSPGKNMVYLGCLLLVLGIFAMLYVRERRLWVWLRPQADAAGTTHALMAMSSQRKTLDFEHEFESLRQRLTQSGSGTAETKLH
jgi:cytochrome c biogenesis protein